MCERNVVDKKYTKISTSSKLNNIEISKNAVFNGRRASAQAAAFSGKTAHSSDMPSVVFLDVFVRIILHHFFLIDLLLRLGPGIVLLLPGSRFSLG